jgi:HEAT repeat protein
MNRVFDRSRVARVRNWPDQLNGRPVPYGTAVDELARLLRDPELAGAAALALARDGSQASLEALLLLLRDTGPDWRGRRLAVATLGEHPLGGQLAADVLRLLHDPNPHVVWAASTSAGYLGLTEAVPHFLEAIHDPDQFVSSGAYNALVVLRWPGDIEQLLGMYGTANYETRKKLGVMIGCRFCPKVWREVYEAYRLSDVAQHREHAARMAHEFGGAERLRELELLANDRDGHVRRAACRATDAIRGRDGETSYGGRDPDAQVYPSYLGRAT